ncbi:hypothetical protein FS837_006792 [Tulasnella sp. UAMH 9824]|nr:hypothetical protein FS837_006792 [Tulasnella sp. UAMH 9824]
MPSVRVRRAGGRPYTVIQDSPPQRQSSLRPGSPTSVQTDDPQNLRPQSERINPPEPEPVRPRRRGTIASLFMPTTTPQVTVSPTDGGAPAYVLPRRDGYPPDDSAWRGSMIADTVLRGRQTLKNKSSEPRLLSPPPEGRAASPKDRRSSYGSEQPAVDIRLSRDDLEGQVGSALSLPEDEIADYDDYDEHHHDEIVDHLDVIDPQVATVTHLSNAVNSIFLPPLSIYSRRPIMNLPAPTADTASDEKVKYKDELDRHVHGVLRKRDRARRIARGVWDFVKTPFWGAAIVIFLAKIINLHNADLQGFWVEVSSQVTNALFTATGVGLIPWRAIDTYRIGKIWYFKRLTRQLRKKAGLEELVDEDDLPDPMYNPDYVHVLTDEQQDELHYQQLKFQQSQTWYRPHATETHRAFPINTGLLICLLIDLNSVFQIMLCGVMWGLNRFTRPAWTTGTLIPASFLCGIAASIFIWRGGAKTKKTEQVESKLREALQLEKEGLMNAHLEDRDGFAVLETTTSRTRYPPANAETMVIPLAAKSETGKLGSKEVLSPDLDAVPSGPASKANTMQAKESKKAPVLP